MTLNGRDFYLGPWEAPESRQEYDRLVAEWLANGLRLPEAGPQEELTVIELVTAYLEFAARTELAPPAAANAAGVW